MTSPASIYQGADGRWYWRVVDPYNRQTVFTGHQSYTRKWSAVRARRKALRRA